VAAGLSQTSPIRWPGGGVGAAQGPDEPYRLFISMMFIPAGGLPAWSAHTWGDHGVCLRCYLAVCLWSDSGMRVSDRIFSHPSPMVSQRRTQVSLGRTGGLVKTSVFWREHASLPKELHGPLGDIPDLGRREVVRRRDQRVLYRTSGDCGYIFLRNRRDAAGVSVRQQHWISAVQDLAATTDRPPERCLDFVVGQVLHGSPGLDSHPGVLAEACGVGCPLDGQVEPLAARDYALGKSLQVRCSHAHIMTGLDGTS
jgi:hypothetical protein